MSISWETRQAIASLPTTVRPWQDGDERCHCTHCDLCGRLFRTEDHGRHEQECQAALVAAIKRSNSVETINKWAAADDERYVVYGPQYYGKSWYCTLWHVHDQREAGPFQADDADAVLTATAAHLNEGL